MVSEPLIYCAVDTADLDGACALAFQIAPVTGGIKLGLEFFNAHGPQGVERVLECCPEASLFLDLKFHDIPNTVAGAVRSICSRFSPAYLNVHATGGAEMMQAAKQACGKDTKLLAVTMLTSLDEQAIQGIGYKEGLADRVLQLAQLTKASGLGGVVCSAHEIVALRESCGGEFKLMVPGIRPAGAAQGDQKRVMSPHEALTKGASHLVIGRPITGADDPAKAAQGILDSI
jgi:orotidine-5'-phosphate decarboxylase